MSVAARARRPRAPPFLDPPGYARHRPESTLLYQLVAQHYPAFRDLRAECSRPLPGYVAQEFEAYLKCGRLEEGFLRVRCEQCHAEKLVAFSCKKRGSCPSCGARRMAETAALTQDAVPRWHDAGRARAAGADGEARSAGAAAADAARGSARGDARRDAGQGFGRTEAG